ncbi:MAG TPA: FdtA/QdtA family cupin domain-containing protein [Bacteroidales bacterium]|nr:FdtA/QdtA family cupin domain-containing protein [Bacteroidales bacterium]
MNNFIESSIDQCILIDLPKLNTAAGNTTTVNSRQDIPFAVHRVYYLYDVPGGESRGGHAHKELSQVLVAICGSFDVILDDGARKKKVTLNKPSSGLLITPGIWRKIINFSSGSVCLVLASQNYNPDDYIRDYMDFVYTKKP